MNALQDKEPRFTTRSLVRGGMIAAIYVALTLLPILTADAVPGLFVGCLLGNLLGGSVWFDVLLGALATLLAALCTRALRRRPVVAAIFPTVFNGLIVGPVVYFAYTRPAGEPVSMSLLLLCMGAVALGELTVCYALGMPMLLALKKLPRGVVSD